jgi:hypothetical protein
MLNARCWDEYGGAPMLPLHMPCALIVGTCCWTQWTQSEPETPGHVASIPFVQLLSLMLVLTGAAPMIVSRAAEPGRFAELWLPKKSLPTNLVAIRLRVCVRSGEFELAWVATHTSFMNSNSEARHIATLRVGSWSMLLL